MQKLSYNGYFFGYKPKKTVSLISFGVKQLKKSVTEVIRGESKKSMAQAYYLRAIKEAGNYGLYFRGFKPMKTLRWLHLSVKNSK